MARKASMRDRLDKLRSEAAATEREKEEKRKAKAAAGPAKPKKRTRAAARKPARMKVVWVVCDKKGEELETFPYPKRAEAEAEAAKGKDHSVLRKRVPFE